MTEKAVFEVLDTSGELTDNKGNFIVVAKQRVVQPDNSFTDHLTISKLKRTRQGLQIGKPTSVFLPISLVPQVVKALEKLSK